jgi:hypothetical protein
MSVIYAQYEINTLKSLGIKFKGDHRIVIEFYKSSSNKIRILVSVTSAAYRYVGTKTLKEVIDESCDGIYGWEYGSGHVIPRNIGVTGVNYVRACDRIESRIKEYYFQGYNNHIIEIPFDSHGGVANCETLKWDLKTLKFKKLYNQKYVRIFGSIDEMLSLCETLLIKSHIRNVKLDKILGT